MTGGLTVVPPLLEDIGGTKLSELKALLDPAALKGLGWNDESQTWAPPAEHPQLGYHACKSIGCNAPIGKGRDLCGSCLRAWRKSGEPSLEHFHAAPRADESLCEVCRTCGHERPSRANGLCVACNSTRAARGQTVSQYVTGSGIWPPAEPKPTFGVCRVKVCDLLAENNKQLCCRHDARWRQHRSGVDFERFCREAPPCRVSSVSVSFQGIRELPLTQVLVALQASVAEQRKEVIRAVRTLVDAVREDDITDLAELNVDRFNADPVRQFLKFAKRAIRPIDTPETEKRRDVWRLPIFGHKGLLSFVGNTQSRKLSDCQRFAEPIRQKWLKECAQDWTADYLPKVRSAQRARETLRALGVVSTVLWERPDRGERPSALDRSDIERILRHFSLLHLSEQVSSYWLAVHVAVLSSFLAEIAPMGLADRGGPAYGLGAGFRMRERDIPKRPERNREEAGAAIPAPVMKQLLSDDSLMHLERVAGPGMVTWIQVQADVGRRTAELCDLPYNCLDYDDHLREDGQTERLPVLVHDMPKVGIKGMRLPIGRETEAVVKAQQRWTRSQYPDTPEGRLRLWPRETKNADGTKPWSAATVAGKVRRWVDTLPDLDSPDRDADGRLLPYDRRLIYPYAFRHTYAQRHVDAGTEVEVLAELMGHELLETTRGYFRVSQTARREAVNRVAPLQIDRNGIATRPLSTELSTTDATRDALGSISVPTGRCAEPNNVAAHGMGCPFRNRCLGCDHYRTDPSYLPDLKAYLNDLLIDRERLAEAVPGLAEWARMDAKPRDEEIAAVRRLIRKCEETLEELDAETRVDVDQALRILQNGRNRLTDGTVTFLGMIRQPDPSLFPRQQAEGSAG